MPTSDALRRFDDPGFFEEQRVLAHGVRLRVRVAGDPSSARLALCLHGFPESSYSWRYQMTLLAELGYRVWAPDLRGYGGSDKPTRVRDYTLDELSLDVAALIDASGASEVLLIGHDWGGAIAWDFVLRGVRPVHRFVVMNLPHPDLFQAHLFRLGPQLLKSWYIFALQLPWLPERYLARDGHHAVAAAFASMAVDRTRFPEAVLDEYRRSAAEPGALSGMLAYYRAAVRHRPTRDYPRVLDVPTLMIWGEEDTALGKELTYGTDERVRDLTLRYIPGCSHWVQQEAPEKVNGMLAAWLRGERVPEASELDGDAR